MVKVTEVFTSNKKDSKKNAFNLQNSNFCLCYIWLQPLANLNRPWVLFWSRNYFGASVACYTTLMSLGFRAWISDPPYRGSINELPWPPNLGVFFLSSGGKGVMPLNIGKIYDPTSMKWG